MAGQQVTGVDTWLQARESGCLLEAASLLEREGDGEAVGIGLAIGVGALHGWFPVVLWVRSARCTKGVLRRPLASAGGGRFAAMAG